MGYTISCSKLKQNVQTLFTICRLCSMCKQCNFHLSAVWEVRPNLGSFRAEIYKGFPNFIKEKYFCMNFPLLTLKLIIFTG